MFPGGHNTAPNICFSLADWRPFLPEQLADWCSRGNQLVVGSLQGHELVVRPLLDHVAPGHDGDDVRVLDGGEAMCDDDAGPTFSGFVQRLLHCLSQKHEAEFRLPERQ